MAAWLALKKLSNQGQPTTGLGETEVTEEQEQNMIVQSLAAAFYKEGSIPSMQPLPQPSYVPIGVSIPPRIRVMSPRDQWQGTAGTIGQYRTRSWLPDMAFDQCLQHNQSHPSVGTRSVPSFRPGGAPPCTTSMVTLWDISSMSREALAVSRVVASSLGSGLVQVAPVHVQSLGTPWRIRHEVQLPLDEHQRDEDDWLQGGDSSKSASKTDNRSDTSDVYHCSSVIHASYNPMSWSHSGSMQLWGEYPTRTVMPVWIRPARVCATPPPHPPVETENADTEGEAAACKVVSQLSL